MKTLFFSSYPSRWSFIFTEARIASALQKRGHDVLFITPGAEFEGRADALNERIIRKGFNLKGYGIGRMLADRDREEIASLMTALNKDSFENLVIDGIAIGKTALYEFLIGHKKMTANLTESEWAECLPDIKNALISFFACRAILDKEKPDSILMYNTLYSVNHVWKKYAERKNIPVYFLHHAANISDNENTLIIAKNDSFYYAQELKRIWSKVREATVPQEMFQYVTDHFLELLKATHYRVYSAPKSRSPIHVRKFFNIKDDQKILTATMASYDEIFAVGYVGALSVPKDLIFASQIDWIEALIDYVKKRRELFLIIRVHPREFPNKREPVKSEHAVALEYHLKNLPENIKVNWPNDSLSLYDLAQETNVFLNSWSSVGVEMSQLGIPVVTYLREFNFYPYDLNYSATSRKDYFDKIELALKEGWNFGSIKYAYRWLALNYCRPITRLKDKSLQNSKYINSAETVASSFARITLRRCYHLLPAKLRFLFNRIRQKRKLAKDCLTERGRYIDISSLEKMLQAGSDTSININGALSSGVTNAEEEGYIKAEIRRLYDGLYGKDPKNTKVDINTLQYNLKHAYERP